MKAPFPWFGGKSIAAPLIWERLGDVPNYVEPFAGSLAVLLDRPSEPGIETVNDLDGFVCNAWRAILHDPDATAHACDWPVNENDLHARHLWLVSRRAELTDRLCGDPDYFDAKIAGWWLWGIACWIGSGWCSGNGPWQSVEGVMKRPHLGDAGKGVNRQLPHLGTAGQGVLDWLRELSARLARVRVCCGDWRRVMGPSVTTKLGITGIVLDPPYSSDAGRDNTLYSCDDTSVAHDVRDWAIEHGDDPKMRIVLCGYDGEHSLPGWNCVAWKANGGYGSQGETTGRENAPRERLWFSPHCLKQYSQLPLFAACGVM